MSAVIGTAHGPKFFSPQEHLDRLHALPGAKYGGIVTTCAGAGWRDGHGVLLAGRPMLLIATHTLADTAISMASVTVVGSDGEFLITSIPHVYVGAYSFDDHAKVQAESEKTWHASLRDPSRARLVQAVRALGSLGAADVTNRFVDDVRGVYESLTARVAEMDASAVGAPLADSEAIPPGTIVN